MLQILAKSFTSFSFDFFRYIHGDAKIGERERERENDNKEQREKMNEL